MNDPAPLRLTALACVAAGMLAGGCATGALRASPATPFSLASVAADGDAARRASMRLLLEGLDRETAATPDAALGSFERALEVDPSNPWAYLVLARHYADGVDPERSLAFLDKAEALLAMAGGPPPGADAHLVGLRGQSLRAMGQRSRAEPLLEEARRIAPGPWADGHLDARELR